MNSGTLTVSGPGFWLGQQDLVSRAKNGICPFARSCCATSLLTLCQELAFPMARKDARLISMQDPRMGTRSMGLIAHYPYSQATHTQQRPMHPKPTSSDLTCTAALAFCYVRPTASHEANAFLAHLRAVVGCCSPSSWEQGFM